MTHYSTLGIDQLATEDEIKRAYFRLIRQHTPEKDPEGFMQIRKAYEQLSDPETREEYDRDLRLLSDVPDDVKGIILESIRLEDSGLESDAANLLERSMFEYAGNKPAVNALKYRLSNIYLEMGNSGKAMTQLEELLADEPSNIKYLKKMAIACAERGWTKRAQIYVEEIQRIEPENEDSILLLIQNSSDEFSPQALGEMVELLEKNGGKAPKTCLAMLTSTLMQAQMKSPIFDLFKKAINGDDAYEQLDLFSKKAGVQPWDDAMFLANKLAEHTVDIKEDDKEAIKVIFGAGVLEMLYSQDRYDLMQPITKVMENVGDYETLESPRYKVLMVNHMALEAVGAGIGKAVAALPLMQYLSKVEFLYSGDRTDYKNEAISFEYDIILEIDRYRKDIKRLKEEFNELYKHSAVYFNEVLKYSESRLVDEANRRYKILRNFDSRLRLDWLGDFDEYDSLSGFGIDDDEYDDYFGDAVAEKNEPIRVVKIGRNEQCPCGSGLKYKKCCGK